MIPEPSPQFENIHTLAWRIFLRFSRGAGFAFISSMVVLLQSNDFSKASFTMVLIASLTGGFMALDKWVREKMDEKKLQS